MINQQLLNPKSIVVVGASNDVSKPGGKVFSNIISGDYKGKLYASNPKENEIQGIISYKDINDLPETDLAIIAIPAKNCPGVVDFLAKKKKTRAFIILSSGFSEASIQGAEYEKQIVKSVNEMNGVLIGPNGIGVLTPAYNGVFTSVIPKLDPKGVDFVSGSGATAVFIMELGIPNGLSFANIYSVGNSAQTGIEDVLEYMDNTFEIGISPKVKLLYLEKIDHPDKFLKHASSLIEKGCKIAAVKAGTSVAGSRAASSHTGALAGSDIAVSALLKKAGVLRCYSRQELITVASIYTFPELKGKNIAVITHAGGPAVMLTDALEKNKLNVPAIDIDKGDVLLKQLSFGSSVTNPIDFLATGTAEQLGKIIDFCENELDDVDAMAVIFGTPGLTRVFDAYRVIDEKMRTCKKNIYPILPSLSQAKEETDEFVSKGRVFFPEEVLFGKALAKVFYAPTLKYHSKHKIKIDVEKIREIINNSMSGYLLPDKVQALLDAAGIKRAMEIVVYNLEEAKKAAMEIKYPIVMKVVGPVHKTDVGGVVINVRTEKKLINEFNRMMEIKDTTAILLQPFLNGTELFVGATFDDNFGHLVLAGLGGIYIEVLKDISYSLTPVSNEEAFEMIKSLKFYKMIEGIRGQKGINQDKFAEIIVRISALLQVAPEIIEMDLNPLLGTSKKVVAVDARIRIN